MDNPQVLVFKQLIKLRFRRDQVTLAKQDRCFVHLDDRLRRELLTMDELTLKHLDCELGVLLGAAPALVHELLSLIEKPERLRMLT